MKIILVSLCLQIQFENSLEKKINRAAKMFQSKISISFLVVVVSSHSHSITSFSVCHLEILVGTIELTDLGCTSSKEEKFNTATT